MRLNFWPLALIIATTKTLSPWQAAATRGPVVVVRPGKEADAGLLAHELEHVRQFWFYGLVAMAVIAAFGLFGAVVTVGGIEIPLYAFSPAGLLLNPALYALWAEWRLEDEVRAYRIQATHYPDDRRRLFAHFIVKNYGIEITEDEALRELMR